MLKSMVRGMGLGPGESELQRRKLLLRPLLPPMAGGTRSRCPFVGAAAQGQRRHLSAALHPDRCSFNVGARLKRAAPGCLVPAGSLDPQEGRRVGALLVTQHQRCSG